MIKSSSLILSILFGFLLFSCKRKESIKEQVGNTHSSTKSILYKGRSTTIMGVIGTQTLKLSLNENGKGGTYENSITYPKGSTYEGVVLQDISQKGVFNEEKTKDFGDVYTMPGDNFYQATDNRLIEFEKSGEPTGVILYEVLNSGDEVPISEYRNEKLSSEDRKANEKLKQKFNN
ncbi:hypothetical protein [Chryseobacterium sp. MEBOG07]|uniref:hypothetical protein n=1 Tax=Chryseobacterium sp. MEBOG07 TaxID=2879939 RepID=UPI001F1A7BF2|nr:hypothetical protein [Chryseobacterium sp. MEBOG07]UKB78339.1 hypothetical protein LF886_17910 [Chryseobacterium sp. MEBOG07]